MGPVRHRIDATYGDRQREADERVRTALESPRYLALLAALDRLVLAGIDEAPWIEPAGRPAREVLLTLVDEEWKRLRRRARAVPSEGEVGADHDAAVHDARKAAKRLRYVVEALVPVWGDDARALAAATKRMSSVLGDRQDTVLARDHLLDLAAAATAADESGFTYGRLHAGEQAKAERLDAKFDTLWRKVERLDRPRDWRR